MNFADVIMERENGGFQSKKSTEIRLKQVYSTQKKRSNTILSIFESFLTENHRLEMERIHNQVKVKSVILQM